MLENRALMVFLEVARTQSMTKTANHLHMTEPSVSRMIRNLEERLGYKLFHRSSKQVTLTRSGQVLQERAAVIVNMVQELEHEFNQLEHKISGKINIGLAETPAFRLIAPVLTHMNKKYPNVHFGIESGNAEQVCAKLDNGLYDFGLVVASFPNAELYQTLTLPMRDVWGVIMPKDHPLANKDAITPADLKDEPLLFSRQEQAASIRPQTKNSAQLSMFSSFEVEEHPAYGQSSNENDQGSQVQNLTPDTYQPTENLIPNSNSTGDPDSATAIYTGSSLIGSVVSGEKVLRAGAAKSHQTMATSQIYQQAALDAKVASNDLTESVVETQDLETAQTQAVQEDQEIKEVKALPPDSLLEVDQSDKDQWLSDSPLKTWFGSYWSQLNIVTSFNLIYNAALLVESRMGLALSIDGIINLSNHPCLCFRPLEPAINTNVSIIWPRFRSFTPAARLLKEEFIRKWGN